MPQQELLLSRVCNSMHNLHHDCLGPMGNQMAHGPVSTATGQLPTVCKLPWSCSKPKRPEQTLTVHPNLYVVQVLLYVRSANVTYVQLICRLYTVQSKYMKLECRFLCGLLVADMKLACLGACTLI